MIGNRSRSRIAWVIGLLLVVAAGGCNREPRDAHARTAIQRSPVPAAIVSQPEAPVRDPARVRDLSIDESMGGHTLARHVGRTDAELVERLRREPQISSASSYTDRETAERAVGAALAAGGNKLSSWIARKGRRPNLVLNYADASRLPVGRSVSRGRRTSVVCTRALVVLRWDDRAGRYYVLTSYPEADR